MSLSETTSALQAASLNGNDNGEDPSSIQADPKSLPVTMVRSYEVDGIPTDVRVQIFQDRTVLTCSQLEGKIGNWLLCKAATDIVSNKIDYDVQHLLGASRDNVELAVYAKRVTSALIQHEHKDMSILLGISLKKRAPDPAFFHTIVDLMVRMYKDATGTAS